MKLTATIDRSWISEKIHDGLMTIRILRKEQVDFKGTGGLSQENRSSGFVPAFSDARTGATYLSRFADGRLAPFHLLDGLPPALIARRTVSGRVLAAKDSVISGFFRDGQFYTRTEAGALSSS